MTAPQDARELTADVAGQSLGAAPCSAHRSYYQDASVTLYHGDALEILPRIKSKIIITDPPYAVRDDEDGTGKTTWKWRASAWSGRPSRTVSVLNS